MNPFGMIEVAVRDELLARMPALEDRVMDELAYEPEEGLRVYIALVSGWADQTEGEWTLDIEVFHAGYVEAMTAALEIEAALLVRTWFLRGNMRIDSIRQNEGEGLAERPWDTGVAYRIGASYTFTGRRSG